MSRYAKLSAGLLAAWLVFALSSSALHLYVNAPNTPPIAFGLAVLTPILLFLVWFASSPGLRQFLLSLSPRTLTLVQSIRIAGFVFLVLGAYRILPGFFALSAGWGDIIVGATAPFAALWLANPAHRKGFIFWQLMGIADLVNALAMGTLAGVIDPHGIPTAPMAVLPMSFISTFGVPLFLILHIICILQARRWQTIPFAATANQVPNADAPQPRKNHHAEAAPRIDGRRNRFARHGFADQTDPLPSACAARVTIIRDQKAGVTSVGYRYSCRAPAALRACHPCRGESNISLKGFF